MEDKTWVIDRADLSPMGWEEVCRLVGIGMTDGQYPDTIKLTISAVEILEP